MILNLLNADEVNKFIIPDYFTGDYVLIHRLKPNSTSDDQTDAEEIDIEIENLNNI